MSGDKDIRIYFITSNIHKYEEAKRVLDKAGIKLILLKYSLPELQAPDLKESIIWKAYEGFKILKNSMFVIEDAGLFIKSLNGFPGVYSSYVYKTIGIEGILKLMENKNDREAYFEACGVLSLGNNIFKMFCERTYGVISDMKRGQRGFGFDPIFIPKNSNKTFAEMDVDEKNNFSHRGKLFKKIVEYLLSR
jgi:XTP/dITP diphosphohydrolase